MPFYHVMLTRTSSESAHVLIEAKTPEDAEVAAIQMDLDNDDELDWEDNLDRGDAVVEMVVLANLWESP